MIFSLNQAIRGWTKGIPFLNKGVKKIPSTSPSITEGILGIAGIINRAALDLISKYENERFICIYLVSQKKAYHFGDRPFYINVCFLQKILFPLAHSHLNTL